MSGKPDPSAENVVTVSGESWELEPIAGMKNFFVVPKIINLVSMVTYSALKADFDLRGIFGQADGDILERLQIKNLLAIPYVMDSLEEKKVEIANDIVPVLLCRDSAWLMTHGEPGELMAAVWKAFKWHAPSLFGEKPWGALKKFISEAGEEATEETDSDSSET